MSNLPPMYLSSSTPSSPLFFDHFKTPFLPSPSSNTYPGAFPSVLNQLLNQYPTTSSPTQLREQILTKLETVHFEPTTLADTIQDITLCQICDRIPSVLMEKLRMANFKEFSPEDLCKVYGAFAYTNHRVTAVLDRLAEDIVRRSNTSGTLIEFTTEQFSSIVKSLAVLNYRGNIQFTRTLAREVEFRAEKFTVGDLGLILQAIAKLKWRDSAAAVDSLANAQFTTKKVDAATLSRSVDALARLDASPQTKQLLSSALRSNQQLHFSPQQQATVVCGLSKLGMLNESSHVVPTELEAFASQDVVRMASACTGATRKQFAQALERDLQRRDLTSVDTTNLLALLCTGADLNVQNQHRILSELATRNMNKFDLAKLVGLTRMMMKQAPSQSSEQLLKRLVAEVSTRDWNTCSHAELSSLVWLFATSKIALPTAKFTPLSDGYVSKCTLSELAVVTNSRLALPPHVVRRITQEWTIRSDSVGALQAEEIAHVLHSFVQFQFYNKQLCSSLARVLTEPSEAAARAVRSLADLKHSEHVPFAALTQDLTKYSPASLVRLAWAIAELGVFEHADKLAAEAAKRDPTAFIARDSATLFMALAKSHVSADSALLEQLIPHNLSTFSLRDLVDSVDALSRMRVNGDVSQRFAVEICRIGAHRFETPQLVFILKGFARWNNNTTTNVGDSVAKELASRSAQLSPYQLCSTLTSLAKLGVVIDESSSLQQLAFQISNRPNATRVDLVQSFQALAELKVPCCALFDRISSSTVGGGFNAQDVTAIVSSAVKLGYIDVKLFRTLCKDGASMETYTPQALANLMWAFAKSQRFPADLFQMMSTEVLDKRDLRTFTPNSLALMLWACSRDEVLPMANDLYTKLLREVEARGLQEFNGQDLANLSQALVAFKSKRFAVFDSIGKEISKRNTMTPQEVTTVLRYFSQILFWSNPLINWVCAHTELLPKYSSQDLSTVMQSFARLGHRNAKFCSAVAEECTKRELQGFSNQSVVNLLHSFACLDVLMDPNVSKVFRIDSFPVLVSKSDRTYEVAQQLYQVRMAWGKPSALLDSLCGVGKDEWVKAMVSEYPAANTWTESHEMMRAVFEKQRNLPKFEQQAQVDLLPVDFLFDGVERCVVELDGPMRFLANIPQQLSGKAMFKHRLLQRQGYTVFSLPLRELQSAVNDVQRGQIVGKIGSKVKEVARVNAAKAVPPKTKV